MENPHLVDRLTIVSKEFSIPTKKIILELTPEEAQCLADILARIGGDPRCTRRCYIDSIDRQLGSKGIRYTTRPKDLERGSSIYFK